MKFPKITIPFTIIRKETLTGLHSDKDYLHQQLNELRKRFLVQSEENRNLRHNYEVIKWIVSSLRGEVKEKDKTIYKLNRKIKRHYDSAKRS